MSDNQINRRLKKFLEYKRIRGGDVEKKTGYSGENVWKFITGRTSNPRIDLIKAFADNYPELNIHWLFTGEGNMLIAEKAEMKDLISAGHKMPVGTVSEKFMEYEQQINEIKEFIRGKFPDFDG